MFDSAGSDGVAHRIEPPEFSVPRIAASCRQRHRIANNARAICPDPRPARPASGRACSRPQHPDRRALPSSRRANGVVAAPS